MIKTINEILIDGVNKDNLFDTIKNRLESEKDKIVDFKTIAEYISKNYPEKKEAIIKKADEALNGMLILPGTGAKPYFVGNPPKWSENPVGDDEYVCVINRTEHWPTLMKAYFLTNKIEYAQKVIQEMENWIGLYDRPPIDIKDDELRKYYGLAKPWRALEVGIRMYSNGWPWVFEALFAADLMTPELLEKLVLSIYQHGEVLEKISPRLWPKANHNHYLSEQVGFLTLAGLIPEFKQSEEWKKIAVREIERCAKNQFTECGGQIEACPHYHNICVEMLRMALVSAEKYNCKFSDEFMDTVTKAIEYSTQTQRSSGTSTPWGDSNADYAAIRAAINGYFMLHDKKYLNLMLGIGHNAKEEAKGFLVADLWDLPKINELIENDKFFEYDPSLPLLPRLHMHKGLKQVSMRTNWSGDALYVFFACNTPMFNGHGHTDPSGFDFCANGKPLLVDPGRFTYRYDYDRRHIRSQFWHNTLTVNNREPYEQTYEWSYTPQKFGDILWTSDKDGIIASECYHICYEPIIHNRVVAIVDESYLLVVDKVTNMTANDTVQLHFHFDASEIYGKHGIVQSDDVAVVAPENAFVSIEEAFVSDDMDLSRKSKIAHFNISGSDERRAYATLCIPIKDKLCDVAPATAEFDGDDVIIKATIDGKENTFVWTDKGISRK